MKLDNNIKTLMALCYSLDNISHYEFTFDKTDNCFCVRIFLNEVSYWLIRIDSDGHCIIREFFVTKSFYVPSCRVSYINKYLKKYRLTSNSYTVSISLDDLKKVLPKVDTGSFLDRDRSKLASYWTNIYRANGGF